MEKTPTWDHESANGFLKRYPIFFNGGIDGLLDYETYLVAQHGQLGRLETGLD